LKYILSFFVIFFFGFSFQSVYCQVDRGGVPRSFQFQAVLKSQLKTIEVASPDILTLQKEDFKDAKLEKPYRVGVEVAVKISPVTDGQWENLPGGGRIWRATILCKNAQGIGLNYNELRLPEGSDIFVYTPDHNFIIGAISSRELSETVFSTRPLKGDNLVIEYYEPPKVNVQPVIDISGIVYMYRGFDEQGENNKSVSSGSCEVNVNCSEGLHWQKQKQGAVKILTKVGTQTFYCTGVLMNNTLQDFSGLLLTAGHCSEGTGTFASDEDYKHWIFYFNYEYPGCSPAGSPAELTIVGSQKLATTANLVDMGSDFLLLKSLTDIPAKYNPFYCGWDAGIGNSDSGVCIHHPDGNVKKISTYKTMLGSGTWGTTPDTHWKVKWAATANGWGVTEGGSSGSPLFDDEGLVIGTLTGGPSSCQDQTGEDSFGKVSYSWTSNGTLPSQQLKPWLDPGSTGILKMPGSFNEKLTVADFSAESHVIPVGGSIGFYDLSTGKPTKWHWYFQGGDPYESSLQNPTGIVFDRYGKMNVKLVVTNPYNSDSIVKEGYIDVRAVVSPNPCKGTVSILTDINNTEGINIEVFDAVGKLAQHYQYSGSSSSSYNIKLPDYGNVFIIRITQGNQVQTHKVVVVH
jgi:PKD repeat protein